MCNGIRTKNENTGYTHRINKHLKMIGYAVGKSRIIAYTGRHSFANVLKHCEGANIVFISESLVHRDLKTTENYLVSFEMKNERKILTC